MTDFGERLKEVAERLGGVRAAAQRTGLAEPTLWNWISGKSSPRFEAVAQLAKEAGVDLTWLAFGGPKAESDRHSVEIPLLSVEASAGHGRVAESERVEGHLPLPRRMLTGRGIDPGRAHMIYVRGDSMEPTLKEGDVVLVERLAPGGRPRPEGIHAVRVGEEVLIKRLVFAGRRQGRMQWRLISDNPAYPAAEVELAPDDEEVAIIGPVRMVMRWM